MSENYEEPAVEAGDDAVDRHLEDDLRLLVDHGVAFARAEVDWQKARVGYAAGRIKWIALLGVLALLLLFFSLVALTVGLVIALTPLIGAVAATLAVFGGLLLLALIFATIAAGQWKSMMAALSNRDTE